MNVENGQESNIDLNQGLRSIICWFRLLKDMEKGDEWSHQY